MPSVQLTFDFSPRLKLRLSDIEEILKENRIFRTIPSRDALIEMCQDGTFETVGNSPTRFGWLVYSDSLEEWLRSMDEPARRAA